MTASPQVSFETRGHPLRRRLAPLAARVDAQEFAWLPPWHRGRTERERAVRSIRAVALKLLRETDARSAPRWQRVLRAFAWPAILPLKAWQSSRDPGQPGRLGRFARGCLDLCCHNLRAEALRPLRAQRPPDTRLEHLYVSDRENQALLIHLHRSAPHRELGDKIAFAAFCELHQLPHIPPLAHGVGARIATSTTWPTANLFVKPAGLWGGQGAQPLLHDASDNTWRDQNGRLVTPDRFGAWAAHTYGDLPWILQPMLKVDPSWAAWSPGPLGTVRIVTIIPRPGDAPEIIAASMRLPRVGMTVDNFSAGALSAEIDWRDGRLLPALGRHGPRRWHDYHPDTREPITGALVPAWAAVCDLSRMAHAAAPDLMAVGWDISCHAGRPILLEANPVFNLAPTVVLGETSWVNAVMHRLSPPSDTTSGQS